MGTPFRNYRIHNVNERNNEYCCVVCKFVYIILYADYTRPMVLIQSIRCSIII